MAYFEHLTKETLKDVQSRLWRMEGSLRGLGSLFEQTGKHACLTPEEFFGIGQLLRGSSIEISKIEEIIRCGEMEESASEQ